MATFTAARAASTFPVSGNGPGGDVKVAYGTYEVTANPVAADVYKMCKVPKGATIIGGMVYADDLDTNATETLDMDLGWAANGGSGTYDSADADGLGNFGVWVGDAFATPNILATVGNGLPFAGVLGDGDFPTFTAETTIQFTCVATCATFTAGAISCAVYYVMP